MAEITRGRFDALADIGILGLLPEFLQIPAEGAYEEETIKLGGQQNILIMHVKFIDCQ